MKTTYSEAVLGKVRREKKWKATAWHEAGHAVAWLYHGYAAIDVSLTPGHEKHAGLFRRRPSREGLASLGPSYMSERRATAEIRTLLAGDEAVKLLTGRREAYGRSGDDETAGDFIICRHGPNDVEGVREYQRDTAAIVTANRAAVSALADALLASDSLRLNGREIARIVKPLLVRVPKAGSLAVLRP